MGTIIGYGFFFFSVFWAVAGKPFVEVCLLFIASGIFLGAAELKLMREEMEDWEE